ncbi:hypothetical protein GWK08_03745 [Leptobacterium flavescens]|uniref:Uncharacterized protein n=1 Tax=Leptobacterium flavescens TaxID=472055 RepID=A0A6P0UGW0_9FLAO|nr:hypothetical protein [Leptobacterium flavescens]NER12541.1 hypothetical protein [Leptobacterium flavescens]
MKYFILLTSLFLSAALPAQNSFTTENTLQSAKTTGSNTVRSLKIEATSMEDLENIDWDDVISVFDGNKEEDEIQLITILNFKKDDKAKYDGNIQFSVKGKTKDLDKLVKRAKNQQRKIKRMYNKLNTK